MFEEEESICQLKVSLGRDCELGVEEGDESREKGLTSKIYRIETAIGESEVSNTVSPNLPTGQSFPFST